MKNSLFKLWRRSSATPYVCLEISRSYLRATLLYAEDNTLTVKNSWLAAAGQSLKEFISSLNLPAAKFIILGDAAFAASIPAWVEVKRDSRSEVNEGELENIISQAVWKFLNHYRPHALESLALSDTDVLLANIRVLNVHVNKHKVLNPIGFKARSIEFLLEQTFVNRDAYKELTDSLPSGSELVFLSQLGIVESLTILSASSFNRPFKFFRFLPYEVLAIESAAGSPRYYDRLSNPVVEIKLSLDWSRSNLTNCFSQALLVPDGVADKLLNLFLSGSVSEKVSRFLKSLIDAEWKKFIEGLKHFSSSPAEKIFASDFPLPSSCIHSRLFSLKPVSVEKIAGHFGFSISNPRQTDLIFSPLAGFLSFRLSERGDQLNKLAERRAKWLIP